jgi:phenylalanyl-tRNA synthetase beta chain
VDVAIDEPFFCHRYTAQAVEGVTVGPSPAWLQRRLQAVGLRPINNVVDVTNYVMLEMGQPLHAFDLDRLAGPAIRVRRAHAGETMVTLDDVERSLDPDRLLICDGAGPVALAGVMGGRDSQVTAGTTRILLEAASFDPTSVRRTAKHYVLHSESSHRFERQVDRCRILDALHRAARLIRELAGGTVSRAAVDLFPGEAPRPVIDLGLATVNRTLGIELDAAAVTALLAPLGFDVAVAGDALGVTVPSWRNDVDRPADLIEEVARAYGYDRIPSTFPRGGRLPQPAAARDTLRRRLQDGLAALGYHEMVAVAFAGEDRGDRLRLAADDPRRHLVRLTNPIAADQACLRTELLSDLLQVAAHNRRHGADALHLFEVATCFAARGPGDLPHEEERIAGFTSGPRTGLDWAATPEVATFFHLKGDLTALLAEVGVRKIHWHTSQEPFLHPGRAADLYVGDQRLGWAGEVHPEVAAAFDLAGRHLAFSLSLAALGPVVRDHVPFRAIPRLPAMERDLALLVPDNLPVETLLCTAREQVGEWLESIGVFDLYRGEHVPAGQVGIGLRLRLRAPDRTLTDADADAVVSDLLTRWRTDHAVTLRS